MIYLVSILCFILGAAICAVWFNNKHKQERQEAVACQERLRHNIEKAEESERELKKLREQELAYKEDLGHKSAKLELLQHQLDNQKEEIAALQKQLTTEFENIANRILKARSEEWSVQSERSLDSILKPFGQSINDFKEQISKAFDTEVRDSVSLKKELEKLTELNSRVSEEANNLTKALKGDVKRQGNWGEVVLERVLESSGLVQGREYEREEVVQGADGNTLRPDVIIHLPDGKHLIVDSKVSLVAYERMMSADNDEEYRSNLKDHIDSVRTHIKELSEKNYSNARTLNSPDFVMLFLPIESSFAAVMQADNELYRFAWDKKIVLVSPTTLLATLRTVASIWKQENQTRNALEIARLSGNMYDKLIGFTTEIKKVQESMERSQKSLNEALNKLSYGQGNVMRTAEKIKELGAKSSKSLPPEFLDS